jgi:hypothetical protein
MTAHAKEILKRVVGKRMCVCIGGRLTVELSRTKLAKLLEEWVRSGQAMRCRDDEVSALEAELADETESDDPHIVALARLSGCRLLFTDDAALICDFKNTTLVSPKGKVIKPSTSTKVSQSLFEKFGP